jgi:uncharacterized metal-binding protein
MVADPLANEGATPVPHRNPHLPLVLACSGASDVGELSDRVGRALVCQSLARLECMSAVGARIPSTLEHIQQAKKVLAIDGCASHCVAKMLQKAGVERYQHLELGDLGFVKGHAPVTEENIRRAAEVACVLFES